MCLYVKPGCGPQIAQTDILVYKVVHPIFNDGHNWRSIYRETKQPYNKPTQAMDGHKPLTKLVVVCYDHIFGGLHAYTSEGRANKEARSHYPVSKKYVRKAIIPKGAEYCYGTGNEIVATKMIVFGSDKAHWKYLDSKGSNKVSNIKLILDLEKLNTN